jgi:hypothetical protein
MSNILVVAEHLEGKLRKATLPTIGFAKKAQALTGGKIIGLVLGHNAASVAAELATAGVDHVIHVDSPIYANYLAEAYAPAVAEIAKVNPVSTDAGSPQPPDTGSPHTPPPCPSAWHPDNYHAHAHAKSHVKNKAGLEKTHADCLVS